MFLEFGRTGFVHDAAKFETQVFEVAVGDGMLLELFNRSPEGIIARFRKNRA